MPSIQEFVPFKDCIWLGNVSEIDYDRLTDFANDIYAKDHEGRKQSNRGGYQSHDIFVRQNIYRNHDEFDKMIDILISATQYGVKQSYDKDVGLEHGNSWVNINNPGDSNIMHCHPGCIFSSVIYLTDNNSPIAFMDAGTARSSFIAFTKATDVFLVDARFTPKKGDYFIFPSWFQHLVEPAVDRRISIATNFSLRT